MRETGRAAVIAVGLALLVGCRSTDGAGPPPELDSTPSSAPVTTTTVATTSTAPTTTSTTTTTAAPPPTLPISVAVGFHDACLLAGGEVGACRCAGDAVAAQADARGVDAAAAVDEWSAAILAGSELPVGLRSAIGACAGVEAAPVPRAEIDALATACTLGDDRLAEACGCAAERAARIVPHGALVDYASLRGVEPDLVDLVDRCLAG